MIRGLSTDAWHTSLRAAAKPSLEIIASHRITTIIGILHIGEDHCVITGVVVE